MSIKYQGRDLIKRIINGREVQKVMYNGQQIRPDYVPPTNDYLCFTANTSGSTVELDKINNPTTVYLEYSYNGTSWIDYTFGNAILLPNVGDKVYFRNKSETPTGFSQKFIGATDNQYRFAMTGSIAASGDVNYLLCKYSTTSLTSNYCFVSLFRNCTSLTAAPKLTATSLTENCYGGMFRGCTNLTEAPELPATTLADWCYSAMFQGCSNLVLAPELPATYVGDGCYEFMFYNCTSLVVPPALPATTVGVQSYQQMFRGCTNLEVLPVLPALTIDFSYVSMFNGCTKIKLDDHQHDEYQYEYRIPVTGTGEDISATGQSLGSMFANTGGDWTGTPSINTTYYTANPIMVSTDYLCFTGTAGSSIALAKIGNPNPVYLEISYDKTTWSDYTFGVQINYDSNINKVYFRNKSTTPTDFSEWHYPYNDYYKFYMSGSIAGSGDITTLLCKTGATTLTSDGCFYFLFQGCTSLITPPRLPATSLVDYCYYYMFDGCSGLTSLPELPATTLSNGCYLRMFSYCTSLTTVPTLPALTLASSCYYEMFRGCTSIISLPELPATNLTVACYMGMFNECTSIKLSDTQGGEYQIPYIIPIGGGGTDDTNSLYDMFANTGGTVSTPIVNQQYWTSNTVI